MEHLCSCILLESADPLMTLGVRKQPNACHVDVGSFAQPYRPPDFDLVFLHAVRLGEGGEYARHGAVGSLGLAIMCPPCEQTGCLCFQS